MAWFKFTLQQQNTSFFSQIESIPGVGVRGLEVTCHDNAAWLVERIARTTGVRYTVVETKGDREPLEALDRLVEGGLREWVPEYLTEYQKEGVLAMAHRDGHFWWAAGCLAGDTEVVVNRAGKAVRMTIKELVRKFNGGSDRGRVWDASIPTCVQSFDEKEGVIIKNRVTAAVASGVKRTFWVQTASGKEIRATADHRFLTPTGWKKLSELREGDAVLIEKWPEAGGKKAKKPQYKYVDHMWSHPHAVRKVWERKDRAEGALRRTAQVALHRLVMEAAENGVAVETWVGRIVVGNLRGARFLRPEHHVHHIDGDTTNNSIINLRLLTEEEHHQLHAAEGGWKRVMAKAVPDRINYIVEHGEEETFDLSMAAPHHNFIANGIVVHNSGKTLGAICWSLAVPGRTVLVTRAGVRRQHAREIERVTTHRALVLEESADADKLVESGALFCLVGYEMLPAVIDRLLLWKPMNVIYDESHTCKSNKRWSATAQADGKVKFDLLDNIATAAYRLSRAARRRLATTATPIKDRTRDLWAQLDLVHPDAWGRFYSKDRASFTGRYCAARDGAYGGVDTSGASNLEELWNRVSLVTHHVPHSVTHRHLPPRRRVVTYVTPAEQCRAEGFTQKFFKQAAKGGGKTGLLEARLMEAAARKRKALKGMVEEAVACGQKVTIFTGRREDCDRLGEEMRKDHPNVDIWCAHGSTAAKDRDAIQQAYMKHPGPCVLVGTGDAWGTGVSLHDTDLALIAMLPYTPGAVVQWEGRFSRQGQKRPVLIQYLVAEGSVDEHVVELLVGKLKPVEEVAHDDSIEGFSDSLRGLDDEEAIVSSILAKLGVTEGGK